MVRFDGRRGGGRGDRGDRGDRNGDAGAEVDDVLFIEPVGTLRLRFFALRGRLGGDGDLGEGSVKISSGIVLEEFASQSL